MRWFVEISPLGKGKGNVTKLCVEAPQWQPALQKARAIRGDDGPIGNFSIELLDDGYRAIDPAARLRYIVRKAPDDAPLSDEAPPKSSGPRSTPPKSSPPKSSAKKSSPPPAKSNGKERVTAKTMTQGSPAMFSAGSQATTDVAPAKRAPISIPGDPVPRAAKPQPELPKYEELSYRAEEPTAKSPLTYREIAYAVMEGTSDEAAERLLRARLADVRASLVSARRGRLVNLAAFDHAYEKRPLRPPIATLTWKDWRGDEPEIRFPLRDGSGETPTPLAPSVSSPPPAPSAPPPAKAVSEPPAPKAAAPEPPAKATAPVPPAKAASPAPKPEPVRATEVAASSAAASPTTSQRPTVPSSEPATIPDPHAGPPTSQRVTAEPGSAPQEPAPATAVVPSKPPAAEPAPAKPSRPLEKTLASNGTSEPPSSRKAKQADPPPPPRAEAKPANGAPAKVVDTSEDVEFEPEPAIPPPPSSIPRLSADDLIAELFEACGDLHFLGDTLEGAEFILALTLEKLPSEAGMVSLFDMNKREFVVVRHAGGTGSPLLLRTPERSPLASTAMRTRHAVVVADVAADPRANDARWKTLGIEPRSVICAPVELGGRYLGLIEIANPLDGGSFAPSEGHALTYIGQQFAEFVAERGVIVDPEAVEAPRKKALRR